MLIRHSSVVNAKVSTIYLRYQIFTARKEMRFSAQWSGIIGGVGPVNLGELGVR